MSRLAPRKVSTIALRFSISMNCDRTLSCTSPFDCSLLQPNRRDTWADGIVQSQALLEQDHEMSKAELGSRDLYDTNLYQSRDLAGNHTAAGSWTLVAAFDQGCTPSHRVSNNQPLSGTCRSTQGTRRLPSSLTFFGKANLAPKKSLAQLTHARTACGAGSSFPAPTACLTS